MQEPAKELPQLGPKIAEKYPFQELKEKLGPKKYDAIVVFGEGPIKDIIFSDEATLAQKEQWYAFMRDPITAPKEPTFRIIDVDKKLQEEKREEKRKELHANYQQMATYSMRRWGKENALAAAYLLYTGKTDKLILTGGKTGGADKPSEAELMKDLIERRLGRLYFYDTYNEDTKRKLYEFYKRTKGPDFTYVKFEKELYQEFKKTKLQELLKDKITLEDKATNTNTNITNIAQLIKSKNIALLSSGHHVDRGLILVQRYAGVKDADLISAQKTLEEVGETRRKGVLTHIAKAFQLSEEYVRPDVPRGEANRLNKLGTINPDLLFKTLDEEKMVHWLNDDDRLPFWLGQALNAIKDPTLLQGIFNYLAESPMRDEKAAQFFELAGLKYENYKGKDISQLSESDLELLREKMGKMTDYKTVRSKSISELLREKQTEK